eukprot:3999593-Pyramimonas_sp.AAC.1
MERPMLTTKFHSQRPPGDVEVSISRRGTLPWVPRTDEAPPSTAPQPKSTALLASATHPLSHGHVGANVSLPRPVLHVVVARCCRRLGCAMQGEAVSLDTASQRLSGSLVGLHGRTKRACYPPPCLHGVG